MRRRRFLQVLAAGAAGLWWSGRGFGLPAGPCFQVPEYAGRLGEILFVYDQCAAPHLFREMVEIVRHAPAGVRVHVLVSRDLEAKAAARLKDHGLDPAAILVTDEDDVSGDWGRDLFQPGRNRDGDPILGVPWFKAAADRADLERTWRKLRPLEREGLHVILVPAAFEGGNLMVDAGTGGCVLFAGSTIAVETRALYRAFYGLDPGDEGVARVLSECLGVDRVVWMGPRGEDGLQRQGRYAFHVDMGMTLVSPGVAVVARCDPQALSESDHRALLGEEAARTVEALSRREKAGLAWPANLDLPRAEDERAGFLDRILQEERGDIGAAAAEMDDMARVLADEGYRVHRLDTDPRRVRRFQSHVNAIVTADRLLMPLFPSRERIHGWVLRTEGGRDVVDVDLGLTDSEFVLEGDNLAAYRLFQGLHPNVRPVRDYFYLASGNVHCVVGRFP